MSQGDLFYVKEYGGGWIVVNCNGVPLSINDLPIVHPGENGKMVDEVGCCSFFTYSSHQNAKMKCTLLLSSTVQSIFNEEEQKEKRKLLIPNLIKIATFGCLVTAILFAVAAAQDYLKGETECQVQATNQTTTAQTTSTSTHAPKLFLEGFSAIFREPPSHTQP